MLPRTCTARPRSSLAPPAESGWPSAQALAAAGANVVLTSRKQEAADEAATQIAGSAIGVAAHAVDEDQARRCIDLAIETFGSVDILVNNAGTNPAYGPMIEQDHDRFAKTFDVNLWAPLLWTALATEAWMGEHGGSVVNIASIGGLGPSGPRRVQHHQGRADLPDQATGAGAFAEDTGQRGRAGRGAHPAGRGAVEGPRAAGRGVHRAEPDRRTR